MSHCYWVFLLNFFKKVDFVFESAFEKNVHKSFWRLSFQKEYFVFDIPVFDIYELSLHHWSVVSVHRCSFVAWVHWLLCLEHFVYVYLAHCLYGLRVVALVSFLSKDFVFSFAHCVCGLTMVSLASFLQRFRFFADSYGFVYSHTLVVSWFDHGLFISSHFVSRIEGDYPFRPYYHDFTVVYLVLFLTRFGLFTHVVEVGITITWILEAFMCLYFNFVYWTFCQNLRYVLKCWIL